MNQTEDQERRKRMDKLKAKLKEKGIDLSDWSDGDPRLKSGGETVWIDGSIDYDPANSWLTDREPEEDSEE